MSSQIATSFHLDPVEVSAHSDEIAQQTWIKTGTLNSYFCSCMSRLLLYTESRDQGRLDTPVRPTTSHSWFEIAIFSDATATEPCVKEVGGETKVLRWYSHSNELETDDYRPRFGKPFERSHEIFAELQPGNVIGVLVCAQYAGWENHAKSGYIAADFDDVAEQAFPDVFTFLSWALSPNPTGGTIINLDDVKPGTYTVNSPGPSVVTSTLNQTVSQLWFALPVADHHIIERIDSIQLVTYGCTFENTEEPCYGYYDIAIMEGAGSLEPMKYPGSDQPIQWKSHNAKQDEGSLVSGTKGYLFERKDNQTLFRYLEVGNAIGVIASKWSTGSLKTCAAKITVKISDRNVKRERAV